MSYFVYILASKKNGILYTGVTNNLERRTLQHKLKLIKGFTSQYNIFNLVWYESFIDINTAIENEKKIKNRNREFKVNLIEKSNINWRDLSADILE